MNWREGYKGFINNPPTNQVAGISISQACFLAGAKWAAEEIDRRAFNVQFPVDEIWKFKKELNGKDE